MPNDEIEIIDDISTGPHYLSKSKLMALHQCPLRLWNETYRPDEKNVPTEDTQYRFASGTRVGELARKLCPEGRLVEAEYWDHEGALRRTGELMADTSVSAMFEAAFEYRRTRARCDLLQRSGDSWELWEVKSVKNPQEIHVLDVAIQAHILRHAFQQGGKPLNLVNMGLVLLNDAYVYDGIEYDVFQLFKKYPCLLEATDLDSRVSELIEQGLNIISSPIPPDITPGDQCWNPYDCPFLEIVCTVPEPHELSFVPGIGPSRIDKLEAEGISTLEEFATSNRRLSDRQKRMLESRKTGQCVVDEGLPEVLADISYPRYYLDFETISPILPRYAGTSPIQMLPFQFSIHIEHRDRDEVEHVGFLHNEDTDPRRPLAQVLLEVMERYPSGPVLSYTNYEKRVLNELAVALPDLKNRIEMVVLRLVDLCDIVRNRVYHPDFGGSFSIKAVFPALVPNRDYQDLEIRDGNTASMRYLQMLDMLNTNPEEARRSYDQLWSYCMRDTEAMVAIMKTLRALS